MKYRFGIIGLGRVGSAMATLLKEAGHTPVWAVSSHKGGTDLRVFSAVPDEAAAAEAVLIAVPDSAISAVAETIASRWGASCRGIAFFHFSGLLSSEQLSGIARLGGETASLHPLQTIMDITQAHGALQESFFTVEGSERAVEIAQELVSSMGSRLMTIAKQDKITYHSAAVIASNYLVCLVSQAAQLMDTIGLSLEHLMPLVRGTVSNLEKYGQAALTGPVQRGDWPTVRAHMTLLEEQFPDIAPSYRELGLYAARLAGRRWPADIAAPGKVQERDALVNRAATLRERGMKVVFTNGCFDIIHEGHVSYLRQARTLGDALVVGLNSDASVTRLKGQGRPINDQAARAAVLAGLACVDHVCVFDEDTPYELIEKIRPDVLVKGGDWKREDIVGSDVVLSNGGEVYSLDFRPGYSTTGIIRKIKGD